MMLSEAEESRFAEFLKSKDHVIEKWNRAVDRRRNRPSQPRVPSIMRDNEKLKKCFEPKWVSIGPYHHGQSHLKITEKIKVKMTETFIGVYFKMDTVDLFHQIKDVIKQWNLRNEYEPDATVVYDDDQLALMFLLDGCFVLYCLSGLLKEDNFESLKLMPAEINGIERDLLLLENQLPLIVLKSLIDQSDNSVKLEESIRDFICRSLSRLRLKFNKLEMHQELLSLKNSSRSHLLALVQTISVQPVRTNKKSSLLKKSIKYIGKLFGVPNYHIEPHDHTLINFCCSFHSFVELKKARIKLLPNDTGGLTEFGFSHGKLMLPIIVLDESTVIMLLNLVAYEMSVDPSLKVSAYICLLVDLITRTRDVEELRRNKILFNFLENDEEVVNLFKAMDNINILDSLTFEEFQYVNNILGDICDRFNEKRHISRWLKEIILEVFGG